MQYENADSVNVGSLSGPTVVVDTDLAPDLVEKAGPGRLQGGTCHQFNALSHSAPAFTEAVDLHSILTH